MSDDESDETREDPFDSFEAPEDREGDPFERLGEIGPEDDGPESTDADGSVVEGDEVAESSAEDNELSGSSPADDEVAAEPLTDSGDSVGEPSAGSGDDAAAGDDEPAFEEEFIDEDDPFATGPGSTADTTPLGGDRTESGDDPFGPDDPFDGMEGREGDPFGEGGSVFESVDIESVDAEEVWAALDEKPSTPSIDGSRYVEVSKHRFCEQCEHFSSPPNAHCTHEDAEIIEYLDMETVRLLNCPIVAEQREIEDEG